MDWASSDERFVDIPGIVEIRWVSDDPEFYKESVDLFDEQKNGLPDYYGKQTTVQAWFTCNVCECDLKSVVTLRAHCRGTQHVRKALQRKMDRAKLKKKVDATSGSKDIIEVFRSGNFENWATSIIKTSRHIEDLARKRCQLNTEESERMSKVEADIARLHRRVAKHVMENMNKYYTDSEDFDPRLHKIRDLRAKIKDSFEAYNGSLEGISLTPDHVYFIRAEVERYFEQIPVISSGLRVADC